MISALQVEKHPTHTPGPNTPPPPRSFHSTAIALSAFTPPSSSLLSRKGLHHLYNDHLTINSSVNGSPILRPQSTSSYYTSGYTYGSPRYGEQQQFKNSPKPHSSPKMKLRLINSFTELFDFFIALIFFRCLFSQFYDFLILVMN